MAKEVDIAETLGAQMKAVSVAEFFKKNKHLLGFDSPVKSMLMVVKEAVDNSLDATEDYAYENFRKTKQWAYPEIIVEIRKAEHGLAIIPEGSDIPIADITKTGKTWDVEYFGRKLRASSVEGETKTYNIEGTKVQLTDTGAVKPQVFVNGAKANVEERTLKYQVVVTDNGPGIIEKNLPFAFGKLLYGSKFHRLRQSRGQQGIGISSAVLYAQQTTGLPAVITSKTEKNKAVQIKLTIADNNEPNIHEKTTVQDFPYDHGTIFDATIEADYVATGEKSVYEFLRRTAIVNPHATILFISPEKEKFKFARTANELPLESKEIKPHPHGLEYGMMQGLLEKTNARNIRGFLSGDLSKVSPGIADDVLKKIEMNPNAKPKELGREEIEKLLRGLHKTPLQRPPTDCLSPIGEDALKKSILKDTKAEFVETVSRKPTVYQGRPFLIEIALAYGGGINAEGMAERLRYANKIPLLHDAAGCAITRAIQEMSWKQYGVQNVAQNGIPMGPYVILVHLASVWVPYTSEGKSAIANYDEIIKEIKLALQDCGRKLKSFLSSKNKAQRQAERKSMFEIYVPELAYSLEQVTDEKKEIIEKDLKKILGKDKIDGEDIEEEKTVTPKPAEGEGE
ncbi:MAG: DNA topoisomerase VI subunit B [Candidatus Nanoarchaeia archaeon]|nr:DNA topoisomerase VI subunit B [Candidatus Nanoarchaeia archaeon]